VTTVEEVCKLAKARYGVVRAPQLAAVYAALPDADPEVARRVADNGMIPAMIKLDGMLAEAETMIGPRPDDVLRMNVYDPHCGVGVFLVAAAHELSHRYALRLTNSNRRADRVARKVLPDIIVTCVYGMDTDPLAVELARLALSLHTGGRLPPRALERHIICGDYRTGDMPPAKRERTAHLGTPARVVR
jgi:hypothetical protein